MAEKILIIEDNKQVRENIVEILESEGYEMYQADGGISGIDISKRVQPDLVICDIMMPEMDGFEVLENMRKNVLTSNIPFIFLTAKDTRDDLRKGMQLGADDYISKPFTIEEILYAVTTRLERIKEFKRKSEEKLNELTLNMGVPVAKELSEPLRAIIGFSSMILTESSHLSKNEIVEFISLIYNAGVRLNKIVTKTMLYYRLESLSVQNDDIEGLFNMTIEDPKTVAVQLFKELSDNASRSNDIFVEFENAPIKIPEQFYKDLLKELIENAFNFSPKNTIVKLIANVDKNKLVIKIADNGIGMSEEEIANISAFMNISSDANDKKGIGLGLVIVKRILRLFGGSISIDSEVGKGTTVIINLQLT